jgi:geranylgeranyl pyrophosphate synthase
VNKTLLALQQRCNDALPLLLGEGTSEFNTAAAPLLRRLFDASAYSLTAGGKRLRPLLVYGAAAASAKDGLNLAGLDQVACATEIIHAYSLVHDDLPAMDDDALRRGRASCHIAFDEATAILVGDALQALAFESLAQAPGLSAAVRIELVTTLAAAAGPRGMAGGQAIDIEAANRDIDLAHLESMHALKTGALIRAAVQMGAIAAGATPSLRSDLDRYATALGLAFQVQDDLLDVEGDSTVLGKQQGADAARNKPTYVTLLGVDGAHKKTGELLEQSIAALESTGEAASLLRSLAEFVISRKY